MAVLSAPDWERVLAPETPLAETILRGSLTYVALFILLRVMKRETGGLALADILLIVIVVEASQNALAGGYSSVADGLLLVLVIAGWAYAVNWLGYRVPRLQRLVHAPPLPLIRDGRMLWRNMRRELITREELMTKLREEGVEDVAQVRLAAVEGDGQISVVLDGTSVVAHHT
jgi:uncharacterized membrane protein YcaP (DUF421 family)